MEKVIFIWTISALGAFGQCINCEQKEKIGQICWGADRSATEVHYASFSDYSRLSASTVSKDYISEAMVHLNWLLENAPCFHRSLYVQMETFLNEVLTKEQDRRRKKEFQKKLKEVQGLKSKYFSN